MRNFWNKCVYILVLQFVFVSIALANTLTVDEAGNVLAETDRYVARFEHGVLVHFHNKLTNETYTLLPKDDSLKDDSNGRSGLSLQLEEGQDEYSIFIDDAWEVETRRLAPLSVEIGYHTNFSDFSDYRFDKTVRMHIGIDAATGDLVIQQHGISKHIVGVIWGCGYLNTQQVDVILPAHVGEIIYDASEIGKRGFREFTYPGNWEAQLAILQGEGGGFFVRSTDTTFRFKAAYYVPNMPSSEHFHFSFKTFNFAPFRGKNEITSVEWRLNAYRGDWQVPAKVYRDWMENAFQPKQPTAWVKDLKLVVNLTNLRLDTLSYLTELVDPSTTLIHLNGWGMSDMEPEYPPKPEFGAFVEAAHGYGFRVMPRVNFIGCSPNHPLYPEFEKYQFRDPFGGHKLGYRATPDYLAPYINPAANAFREYLVGRLKTLYETYSIDAWHLDINYSIVNDANGLIDGLTPAEGNVLLHQELAAAMPGVVFGGERLHEVTFPHVSLAMRWSHLNKQPHPISSFLFSSWTVPYAHTSVTNPDDDPELYEEFRKAYTVWNVLPTIRIRAPWMLAPYRIRTWDFFKSIRNGQTWKQTWNINVGTDIVGDVNEDGVVNVLDLIVVAQEIGTEKPSNPRVDVNGDGVVNVLDLIIVAQGIG